MPRGGQRRGCGGGPATADRKSAPPLGPAGKNFRTSRPASARRIISVMVPAPGSRGRPASRAADSRRSGDPGSTMNEAPARRTASTSDGVVTVPAPTRISGTSAATRSMAESPAAVRRVISRTPTPPRARARARGTAAAASCTTTTGMTGLMATTSAAACATPPSAVITTRHPVGPRHAGPGSRRTAEPGHREHMPVLADIVEHQPVDVLDGGRLGRRAEVHARERHPADVVVRVPPQVERLRGRAHRHPLDVDVRHVGVEAVPRPLLVEEVDVDRRLADLPHDDVPRMEAGDEAAPDRVGLEPQRDVEVRARHLAGLDEDVAPPTGHLAADGDTAV